MASTSTSIPSPSPPPPPPTLLQSTKKQSMLADLRLPVIVVATVSTAVLSLFLAGPSFRSVVSFFWPLLLSTSVFLAAIVVLRLISPPHADLDDGKVGSGIIDYVAGSSLEDDGEVRARSSSVGKEEEGGLDGPAVQQTGM